MRRRDETAAVIVAAGRGQRAGPGRPKQWRSLNGRAVLAWTLDAFRLHPSIGRVVLVLHPDDMGGALGYTAHPDVLVATGGANRRLSVMAGLEALAENPPASVLIHDVARPLVSPDVIDRVISALDNSEGAAPALAVHDALWTGAADRVTGTQDRTGLFRAQTPQGFWFETILTAHRSHAGDAADDVAVAQQAGVAVTIVQGDERNFKITTAEDFARAETLMETPMDIRTGTGFDVHAFTEGDHVILCGIAVPHDRALLGHSDADVAMHALTDAIYGALAEGDIGRHFPPSDPQWKGAASDIFLLHAKDRIADRGFRLSNVDVTIICETPKIGAHATKMIDRMAGILEITPDRISVKATTSEGLGFTGRKEGIAALATVTLITS